MLVNLPQSGNDLSFASNKRRRGINFDESEDEQLELTDRVDDDRAQPSRVLEHRYVFDGFAIQSRLTASEITYAKRRLERGR